MVQDFFLAACHQGTEGLQAIPIQVKSPLFLYDFPYALRCGGPGIPILLQRGPYGIEVLKDDILLAPQGSVYVPRNGEVNQQDFSVPADSPCNQGRAVACSAYDDVKFAQITAKNSTALAVIPFPAGFRRTAVEFRFAMPVQNTIQLCIQ